MGTSREGASALIPPANLLIFFLPYLSALGTNFFFSTSYATFSLCVGLWFVLPLCLVAMVAWFGGFFLDYNRWASRWNRMIPDDPLWWEGYAIER